MAVNEALLCTVGTKKRDFQSVLGEVQKYISGKHGTLITSVREEQKRQLKAYMVKYVEDHQLAVEGMATDELIEKLHGEMAEFSVLTRYLYDSSVEEINVNSWRDIKITYADGRKESAEEKFNSPGHALDVVKRLLRKSNIILDESNPMVRGHLNNKIRITAYTPPIIDEAVGVNASIRIINPKQLVKEDFVRFGTATKEMMELIQEVYRYGISVSCTGATSSGKTTLMSCFLSNLPNDKRIFTAENGTREFNLEKVDKHGNVLNNVIHTVTKDSEDERMRIDTEKLLEFALTTNPDYICVAEMKGPESFAAQEAARTGHAVITTTHANGCEATYYRMVTLCKTKYDMKDETLYNLVTEAFPIVLFCKQLEDNSRKIMEITECVVHPDNTREIRTLWRYKIHSTSYEKGKAKVEGEFVRENAISHELAKRLRENGMPEDVLAMFTTPVIKHVRYGAA